MDNLNFKYEKVVLVYVTLLPLKDMNENLQEFLSLARSLNIKHFDTVFSVLKSIHSKYFIGIGKLLELDLIIKNNSISVILFNCILSASQERNLNHFLKCKIIDRNQLILNIFAQRARTYEGKLQVKLAQLRYLNSRLTHEWNHLERQEGGIRTRGGPGEKQLESDRRLLSKSALQILSDLKKIKNQRAQNRFRRAKVGISSVSLVGYTNAGKSTVFNMLTSSHVNTSNKLFETLDPTFRRIVNFSRSQIMLIDTVGFIQNLPQTLIQSFKSTLEETVQSTLLLHVIDYSNKKFEQHVHTVNNILNSINIYNIPVLMVMNKIDCCSYVIDPHIDRNCNNIPIRVWISAKKNLGIDLIKKAIDELLPKQMIRYEIKIPIDSDLYQKLYQIRAIEECHIENNNTIKLKIYLSDISWNRLLKTHKSLFDYII